MASKISDETYVSLPLIITLCAGIIGAAIFITKINIQTNANASSIVEIKTDTKEQLREINQQLKEIRTMLERRR